MTQRIEPKPRSFLDDLQALLCKHGIPCCVLAYRPNKTSDKLALSGASDADHQRAAEEILDIFATSLAEFEAKR